MSAQYPPEAILVGPLPRNWERAFGYDGEARWLAVYWMPAGNEAVYDDGRVAGDGFNLVFSDLVDHALALPLARALPQHRGRFALGSSDAEATHCLLLDLQERQVYVSPIDPGLRFVRAQWPEPPPVSVEGFLDLFKLYGVPLEPPPDPPAESVYVVICEHCIGWGWIRADDGGYDRCPECGGSGIFI